MPVSQARRIKPLLQFRNKDSGLSTPLTCIAASDNPWAPLGNRLGPIYTLKASLYSLARSGRRVAEKNGRCTAASRGKEHVLSTASAEPVVAGITLRGVRASWAAPEAVADGPRSRPCPGRGALDADALLETSCECHATLKARAQQLLGVPRR